MSLIASHSLLIHDYLHSHQMVLLLPLLSVPLLFMAFPGVPQAGRAVVNGASGAVSALAGFHP